MGSDSDSESPANSMESDSDSDFESKLIPLICLLSHPRSDFGLFMTTTVINQIIIHIRSMDLDSLPKPESKLMSLVTETVSLFNSTDLDSLPKPLKKLISFISQKLSTDLDQVSPDSVWKFKSLVDETLELKPAHEIISLIRQIVSLRVNPRYSEFFCSELNALKEFILLCPQGVLNASGDESQRSNDLWDCFLVSLPELSSEGEGGITCCFCRSCNGEYHKEYEKAPLEIKHPLHQKHSLQLVYKLGSETRKCYCCDDDLQEVFYSCLTCDCAINIVCEKKPIILSIPYPKWHEHPLALFPRKASLTCDVCGLADSNSPFYICSPCDFLVHLKCINLPLVLRISRHPHRLRYTPSFEEGDCSCSVCRRKIHIDYGGYSCVKDSCSYKVHSRCATQSNVWDGIDLEREPEEMEEEDDVEPFVKMSDGIIRHFSHDNHHLRLDENICRDYDDNKLCEACITPVYFGNLYSCLQCQFVLHETCANLSLKIYHPIHPHLLTLNQVGESARFAYIHGVRCSGCNGLILAGLLYECSKGCGFRLHVQCATLSEPLVYASHKHPLFLTSKPGEERACSVCPRRSNKETFNCIDCDDFALCFKCATLPQKVRYKHDKHIQLIEKGKKERKEIYHYIA